MAYTTEQKNKILSFEKAKEYIHTFKFKNVEEYKQWFRKNNDNITPGNPSGYYKNEWISWNDFLGKGNANAKNKKYLSFIDARKIVQTLNLKSGKEWNNYSKLHIIPDITCKIPHDPRKIYKNNGWISMEDWLGTNTRIYKKHCNYLEFNEAKKLVHSFNFKTGKEWNNYIKSNLYTSNLPKWPWDYYKEWVSIGDWLGTNYVATNNREYLPFNKAKQIIHKLKLNSGKEYKDWYKINKPNNIPSNPSSSYKDEWISMGDWLGTNRIANQNRIYKSYEECKQYIYSLKLKNKGEWFEFIKNNKLPFDIPNHPKAYKEFTSWPEFLGSWQHTQWQSSVIISFIKSLKENIHHLDYADLLILCQNNGLQDKLINNPKLNNIFATPPNSEARKLAVQSLLDTTTDTMVESEKTDEKPISLEEVTKNLELSTLNGNVVKAIESLDDIQSLGINTDSESLEYFKVKYVNELWYACIKSNNPNKYVKELNSTNKPISNDIITLFKSEYEQVSNMKIPKSYGYKKKGKLVVPNLMQKLTAFRVKHNNYLGNWSDTGTGKTISALLSAGYIEAKTIVIIANNSTIHEWKDVISKTYKNAEIELNPINSTFINNRNNKKPLYVIINYDKFSNKPFKSTGKGIGNILLKLNPDFVVFDEIQMIKQRTEKSSKRRHDVLKLLNSYRKANGLLKILGMSATPIMNELMEPVKLLELLTGNDYSELDTTPNIANAIAIHKLMRINGIRFSMEHKSKLTQYRPNIERQDLMNEFKENSGSIISMERTCLKAKLDNLQDYIKDKTMIYLHYVDNKSTEALMLGMVKKKIDQLGLTYNVYTGGEKDNLDSFTKGNKQVLICSRPVNTGVDGLQDVCSNMIILSLPWTYAEYKQLIGRIQRQGQLSKGVNIYIPRVYLKTDKGEWSWDDERWNLIMTKKTLSDLVMDGDVPSGKVPTKQVLLGEAIKKLDEWILQSQS